jgi:RNA polymerase sigma-70 factor (ECF subfamily)
VNPLPAVALDSEAVFRDFAPRIYSIAKRLLDHDADAEEVTGEVLLQVVRKLQTFRGDSSLGTWLHRVTVNAALALREKRANRRRHEQPDPEPDLHPHPRMWSQMPDSIAMSSERQRLIERAIADLPELYRDTFVLADVEGLPNAEIGEILGLGLAAVKSRLHRARLLMREKLARHFEDTP